MIQYCHNSVKTFMITWVTILMIQYCHNIHDNLDDNIDDNLGDNIDDTILVTILMQIPEEKHGMASLHRTDP